MSYQRISRSGSLVVSDGGGNGSLRSEPARSSLSVGVPVAGLWSPHACTARPISGRRSRVALLHKPSAQPCKFGIADRSCLFQPTELVDFICDAETNRAPEFIARLPSLLRVTLRHAPSLKDQVYKHEEERKYDPPYHPTCLDPAGDVVASEQIGSNSNEQPEPHDEEEYCEGVHQEISIREALL